MRRQRIDLIWLGTSENQPFWSLGEVYCCNPSPQEIYRLSSQVLPAAKSDAYLFWDSSLGTPEEKRFQKALDCPGNIWHSGLTLGLGGLPGLLDFVNPTWMLTLDPPIDIEATSWRLSLRCCLIKTAVLQQLGTIRPEFETLEGASLEMGHRYVKRGVLPRHLPWLLAEGKVCEPVDIPFLDELRFIHYQYGPFWMRWSLMRALFTGYVPLRQAVKSWKIVSSGPRPALPEPFNHGSSSVALDAAKARVSVLIPTLERYPYLRTLLNQLRSQTIKPTEIIVVDQTPAEQSDVNLAQDFADLPLRIIYLDYKGQCVSRNAGLNLVRGDFVLFIDDDDEVSPRLIESHLNNLNRFCADVSSGVADDVKAGPLPWDFTFIRASDVFPTNNTLIKLKVLERSGLFDLAYNRLSRADGDLGVRIYLSGAFMVLNPEISVLHHHAPSGGLRIHKARVITHASSRLHLTQRHLPVKSEIYLAKRYFTPRQVREHLWLRAFGTLSMNGSWLRKGMRVIVGSTLFPHTLASINARKREAEQMLLEYPQIPTLPDTMIN
jgi:glycosyltransferase involved in cell wall biosynthesis